MPTNDTDYSYHVKAVELVDHSFESIYLHNYLQRTQRNSVPFGAWKMQDASKLNWE